VALRFQRSEELGLALLRRDPGGERARATRTDFYVVMEMSNGNNGRSHEEGLRVHHLANLGGLIAIAGLDPEPPDFLLGALLSLAQEAAKLSREQRAQVASMGRSKLNERATGKRAWKSWNRTRQLQAITLSTYQLRDIIEALGGEAPEDATQLPLALSQILTEVSDGAA
jgi:hypothetical protein